MSSGLRADVIVVGLGPAGARAAAVAARDGLRVIGVDRKKVAGLPVQCAEFVPGPLHTHIANLAASTRQAISSMTTMIEMGDLHHTPDFRGAIIDRARFDQRLVAEAREAGVHIIFASRVMSIGASGLRLCDGTVIDAGIIIGADGPRSVYRQSHRRGKPRTGGDEADHRAPSQAPRCDRHLPFERLSRRLRLAVSARRCCASRSWRHSFGAQAAEISLASASRAACRRGSDGDRGSRPDRRRDPGWRHAAPGGRAHGRAVLLAGDAAGLTNPVTGAGIAAAVLSGQMAGEAAAALHRGEAGVTCAYVEELREVFGVSLARAVSRRRDLLRAYANSELLSLQAMRQGWIAFPEYWSRLAIDASSEERRPV